MDSFILTGTNYFSLLLLLVASARPTAPSQYSSTIAVVGLLDMPPSLWQSVISNMIHLCDVCLSLSYYTKETPDFTAHQRITERGKHAIVDNEGMGSTGYVYSCAKSKMIDHKSKLSMGERLWAPNYSLLISQSTLKMGPEGLIPFLGDELERRHAVLHRARLDEPAANDEVHAANTAAAGHGGDAAPTLIILQHV